MADARLEVAVGEIKFCAEGTERWVDAKYAELLKLIERQPSRPHSPSPASFPKDPVSKTPSPLAKPSASLATFLRERNAGGTQVKRFLATAIWLQRAGSETLKTGDVAKALTDARQQPLKNPADVLNQNVAKGFCVKSGDGFYVTPEGEESVSE